MYVTRDHLKIQGLWLGCETAIGTVVTAWNIAAGALTHALVGGLITTAVAGVTGFAFKFYRDEITSPRTRFPSGRGNQPQPASPER